MSIKNRNRNEPRYFLHDDALLQGVVVRILLRAVERCLRAHSPGSSAAARLGAVVFIHRFGSSLNAHRHFHCCILDGVFAPAHAADAAAGVVFHEASALVAAAAAKVQTQVRHRVLRAFVRRGLLEPSAGEEMGGWAHGGGFSLDAAVRIDGADRAGRERLLRYCARPLPSTIYTNTTPRICATTSPSRAPTDPAPWC